MASFKRTIKTYVPTEKQMVDAFAKLLSEGESAMSRQDTAALGNAIDEVGKNYLIISDYTDAPDNDVTVHRYKVTVEKL